MGPATEGAIKQFQREIGVNPTGKVDDKTKLAMSLAIQANMDKDDIDKLAEALGHQGQWTDPLENMSIRGNSIRNTFGMVRRNEDGTDRPHQGVDLPAPIGTNIKAVSSGEIVQVRDKGDYGLQILHRFRNKSGDIRYAFYAHLSKVSVKEGDLVKPGMYIGQTGISGNADKSSPHLHFEIRTRYRVYTGLGGRVDPMPYFNAEMEVK